MPAQLRISIHFLDGAFHGRGDGGEPEWPPSPLRFFQAAVNAAAVGNESIPETAAAALRWLEQLPPPEIIAAPPAAIQPRGYHLYVPDNVGDLVGKSWAGGKENDIANYRTEKFVRPMRLANNDDAADDHFSAVHFIWTVDGKIASALSDTTRETLLATVRSVFRLGWGIDLVVADASILDETDATTVKGQRYFPTNDDTGLPLRVPQCGTLDDLEGRHKAFLNRVSGDSFSPVPPLTVYNIVNYRSENEPQRSPRAVFALRQLDDSKFRPFNTARNGLHVVGMLRHAASRPEFLRSLGWGEEDVRRVVLGHGEVRGHLHKPVQGGRLAFLPLPSIEKHGAAKSVIGSIRRVAVTTFGTFDRGAFRRLIQQLDGQELVDEKLNKPIALLARQPGNDGAIKGYFQSAATWATVTPVILPGYDDPRKLRQRIGPENAKNITADEKTALLLKLDKRIEFLLRKAIRQAGFSDALAQYADLEWRSAGFLPGTELASRYSVPNQHRRYRRLHVRITWRNSAGEPLEIAGPICIGGGKFSGLGLFVPVNL